MVVLMKQELVCTKAIGAPCYVGLVMVNIIPDYVKVVDEKQVTLHVVIRYFVHV